MITRVLKGWETLRLSALVLAVVAVGTSIPHGVSLAQPAPVTIRGFEFDPAELQRATAADLVRLGIDEGLQARAPAGNDVPHWRLLQFSRPINRETRRDLVASGLELQRYMAGMYLERVTLDTVDALRSNGVLRASVLYHPAFKLMPSIRGAKLLEPRTFQTERRRAVQGSLLRASTFPAADLDATAREIRRVGGLDVVVEDNRRYGGPGLVVFRLDGAGDERTRALTNVARIDEIESIEEVGEIIPDNAGTASVNQSGNPAQPTIWNRDLAGQGQAIGIFDFGVADTNHCFFNGPAKVLEIRNQSQITEYGASQHPTIVAAIAAGADSSANPANDAKRGGAWAAKLVLANIYDFYAVDNHVPPSTLAAELVAVATKANISSHSWHDSVDDGDPTDGYSMIAAAFDRFVRTHEDHVVVAAAGTAGAYWGAPAISKNSITVSAASLNATQITDSYSTNPPLFHQQKPDLAAASCGIETAVQGTSCGTATLTACKTSWATPHAAAIAALARQYYVEGRYQGVSRQPTASLVKATMINSARDVTGVLNYPSELEGWGVVRLDRSLAFPDSDRVLFIDDVRNTDQEALETGGQRDYTFEVEATSQPLKVTLVWADPPGTVGVGELVNNLDLEVSSPPGTGGAVTYFGNHFNTSIGESIPAPPADTNNKDNVEEVIVNSPPVGSWTLRVKAKNIAQIENGLQGQGYALVATGGRPSTPNPPTNLHVVQP